MKKRKKKEVIIQEIFRQETVTQEGVTYFYCDPAGRDSCGSDWYQQKSLGLRSLGNAENRKILGQIYFHEPVPMRILLWDIVEDAYQLDENGDMENWEIHSEYNWYTIDVESVDLVSGYTWFNGKCSPKRPDNYSHEQCVRYSSDTNICDYIQPADNSPRTEQLVEEILSLMKILAGNEPIEYFQLRKEQLKEQSYQRIYHELHNCVNRVEQEKDEHLIKERAQEAIDLIDDIFSKIRTDEEFEKFMVELKYCDEGKVSCSTLLYMLRCTIKRKYIE